MGKTSLALNMAVAAAKDEKKPVAVFSLEMTKQELVERLLSSEARLDASKLRRGAIADRDWEKIGHAMGVLHELPIYLDDGGAVTVTEIRSRLRRLKSAHGLSAVFIDYLQLVRPPALARQVNRNEELSDICRTLKATAKDLGVPIIALAQLNRAVETRADKRPMLSDLRDCLTADALVTNADTGERVSIGEIVRDSLRFNVWAVDERLQLVRKPITDAWKVAEKPVFRVTTQSGRTLRCSAGHRFLTASGWMELRDLESGRAIAAPRPEILSGASFVRRSTGNSAGTATLERATAAQADILWEPIVTIDADGVETVYDITVGELHNFCVNDLVTHNSGAIEQEADIVTFLYRDVYYNKETSQEPDVTELIIAKHRNGRVGTIKLRFQPEHTLFVPYGDESHYPNP
jgi:replicative DNA helicase